MPRYTYLTGLFAMPHTNKIGGAVLAAALLILSSGVRADDSEIILLPDGKTYQVPRGPYDSPPLLPLGGEKTPISSGLMKLTTTVDTVTFDSNYDNGSLYSVSSGGTNVFNLGLFVEDSSVGLGSRSYHFRFKMAGVAGRTITLNLNHSSNPRPFISLDGGATWTRLTAAQAPSSSQIILSFTAAQNTAELAFFEPLGYSEIHSRVDAIVLRAQTAGVTGITTEVLGNSFQGRQQWLVNVTDPAYPNAGKFRVWLHARAHAGEVTASHTMLGFLDQITTTTSLGQRLRRHCIFNILPCNNVDGVYLGCTRWDSQGRDPEREWAQATPIPEVQNIKNKIDAYMAGSNPIRVCLNLHSTVNDFADSFFFKHVGSSVTPSFEALQQRYIDAFNAVTPLFNNLSAQTSPLDPTLYIESYVWNNWGETVMAMTHEGHYYNRITDGIWIDSDPEYYSPTSDGLWITGSDYQAIGRAQAEALMGFFDVPVQLSTWTAE